MNGLRIKYRRFKGDRLIHAILYMVGFSWLLGFLLIILFATISTNFIYRESGARLGTTWNSTLAEYAFYVTVILFINCISGLVFNYYRHRRKNDTYHVSLLFFGLLSAVSIVLYLIR